MGDKIQKTQFTKRFALEGAFCYKTRTPKLKRLVLEKLSQVLILAGLENGTGAREIGE